MKKLLFASLAAIVTLCLGTHESKAQAGPLVRIFVMPQSTWTLNQDDADRGSYAYESTFGAAYGIGGGFRFSGNLGLGLDLIYSMEGQKYTLDLDSASVKITLNNYQKLNYLKIPLELTFNSNPEKRVMFAGRIGPQVSMLLSDKLESNDVEIDDPNLDDYWSSLLFGATLSTGIDIRTIESLLLNLGLRFDYTFGNSENEDHQFHLAERAPTHNITGGFQIGLKYLIGE